MSRSNTKRLLITLVTALAVGVAGMASAADAPSSNKGKTKTTPVVTPTAGSPELIVHQALMIALDEDERRGFKRYLELVHPDRKPTPRAISQIERYSWTRFRRQAPDYLLDQKKGGFEVERRDPEKVDAETKHVRLFLMPLNNERRAFATPIRLERYEGRWYITANSL